MFWYKLCKFLLYIPSRLIMPTKRIGQKIPKKGKYIVICNHQSYLDIPAVGMYVNRPLHFVAKKELRKNKLLNFFMKLFKVVAIDRDKPDLSSFKEIYKVLKNNELLCIFPEGTRNRDRKEELLPFKNGVALFALKTRTPIVPMFLVKKPKFFSRNRLIIGEPLDFAEYYDKGIEKDVLDEVTRILYDKTLELQNLDTKKQKNK